MVSRIACLLLLVAAACAPAKAPRETEMPQTSVAPAQPTATLPQQKAIEAPAPIPALAAALYVHAGRGCVILRDGGVSCWGGREGAAPKRLKDSDDVVSLAFGLETLLSRRDGTVTALRQDGSMHTLSNLRDVAQVAGNWLLSCVRFKNGTVSCYRGGVFADHQPNAAERKPTPVLGIKDATDIDVGPHFACAVRSAGSVACAAVAPESKTAPRLVVVPGVTGAQRVFVATSMACAHLTDGRSQCFSLGRKQRWFKEFPAADAIAVHQGDAYDSPLFCASRGPNVECERLESLGGGHALPTIPDGATALPGVARLSQLRIVNHAICGLDVDGGVHCFGYNLEGILGQPNTRYLEQATPVPGVPEARAVAVGDRFVCSLSQGGEVWCWGQAVWALKTASQTPADSRAKRIVGLTGMTRLIANEAYACAFDQKDHAHCFFGVDDPKRSRVPYRVSVLDGVRHALLPDMGVLGQVVAISKTGQLLLGPNPGFDDLKGLTLTPVSGLDNVRVVTGAYSRFLVQKADGSVYLLAARQGVLQDAPTAFPALDGAKDLLGTRLALFDKGEVRGMSTDEKSAHVLAKSSDLVSLTPGPGVCGTTAKRSVLCVAATNYAVADTTLFENVHGVAGNADTQCAIDTADRVLCRGRCEAGQCGLTVGVHYSKIPLRVPLTQ
ncbi:MAG TPA: hypothetical protein PKA88_16510 [Polyangiaceae bacterium]|nr:hypothetical protein [Polyangiaceae bacterium]